MRAASPVPRVAPKILFGTTLGTATGLARGSKILFGGAPVLVPVRAVAQNSFLGTRVRPTRVPSADTAIDRRQQPAWPKRSPPHAA